MDHSESRTLPPRSRRDWAVDIVMVLAAVAFGAALSLQRLDDPSVPDWLLTLDQVAGGLGCAALWLRRRWPVGIALGLVPLSTFSELVAGAQIVALFTVAVHRPVRVTVAVSGLSLLSAPVYVVLRPEPGIPGILVILLGLLVTLAVVGWGLFVRHRRQLILSLRERAARAETEARLRAEQAQHLAREEIAREMHDVLGHRLSLLSVHAGALEYRRDASAEEVARAAGVIRESAHQALQDLREVIGVLRAPMGELPQPTLADVCELVADSVRAGMRVELRTRVTGEAPASVGRTAYRIVQEGLTNVRRHAPGAQVCVTVHGAPGEGLTVEVRDSGMARETAGGPESGAGWDGAGRAGAGRDGAGRDGGARDGGAKDGSRAVVGSGLAVRGTGGGTGPCDGHGLIGLAERASLAGGRLEHGPVAGGGFVLSTWLPWPA